MRTNCLDTREPNSPRSTVEVQPYAYRYVIRINDVIGPPSEWVEEISAIQNSGPNDVIHIYCNSPGGSLYTATEILSAMLQTDAHIITELTGEACSAAALIFLAGDEFRVSDDGTLMNHGASYGVYGTQQQVYDNVVSSQKQLTKLARKYYAGFLSEEEIEKLIEGKEFWMDAPEIIQRLEKRSEYFKIKSEQKQTEEQEAMFAELSADMLSEDELKCMSKQELIGYIMGRDVQEGVSDNSVEIKTLPDNWESSDGLWFFEEGELRSVTVGLIDLQEEAYFGEEDLQVGLHEDDFNQMSDRKLIKKHLELLGLKFNNKTNTQNLVDKVLTPYLKSILQEFKDASSE